MNDKLKNYWKNKSAEEVEKSFEYALIGLYLLEVVGTFAIYFLLMSYASYRWADTWLAFAFAYTLKSNIDMLGDKIKNEVMQKVGHEKSKEDNIEEKEQDANPAKDN